MIKTLHGCFSTKTQYSFIFNYRGVGEGLGEEGLSKWNQGKLIEIS